MQKNLNNYVVHLKLIQYCKPNDPQLNKNKILFCFFLIP